jgi:hypothetical protein
LETGVPATDQDKLPNDTREDDPDKEEEVGRWRTRILSTLHHVHHHEDSTAMTNRCTKSFHIFHINQIDRV